MSPLLALQAAAIYVSALVFAPLLPPAGRRAALVGATLLVLSLPLRGLVPAAEALPRWSPPVAALPAPVVAAVGVLQEPPGEGAAPAAAPPVAWLGLAWGLGAALVGLRLAADLRAAARLRRGARDRVGDVATSDAVAGPLVVGAWSPLVLLPPEAAAWSPARRAQVLAHERAHVAGRDNLWLLLARVAACVHWFDPLAHRAVAALRDACERRADESALAGGADPADYARTLLDVARGGPAVALGMARSSGLEARVRAVLAARPAPRPARAALAVAAMGALSLGAATAAPALPTATAAPALPTATVAGPPAAAPTRAGALERLLAAEAERLQAAWQPEALGLLVLDVRSGAVLGELDRGGLLDRPVAPGSVLKPFTVAAALERGVPADTVVTDGTLGSVLACSSNQGAVEVGGLAGREAVAAMYGRVGLPAPAELSLEALVLGDGLTVTPRQVAGAWRALAGGGAIAAPLAAQVRGLLRGVTEAEDGTGRAAAVPGLAVAGKTGTAPLPGARREGAVLASFVGLVPAEAPTTLVLVMVAAPRTDEGWGGKVAAPAFRDIVEGLGIAGQGR